MDNDTAFRDHMKGIVDHQAASPKSPVISEEKYNAIRRHLLNPTEKVDAHFKHWVKTRHFQILNLPGIGLHNVVVIPSKEKNNIDSSPNFLRVIHSGIVFDVVKGIHVDELQHSGYKKVMDYAQQHFFGITRGFIQEYCKKCPVCQLNPPKITKPPFRPIIHSNFLDRIQINLIDMCHSPDRSYNYIGHVEDHFSKYHVLFPLETKTAEELARLLEERVLAYFGPPNIFHSDDNRDFVNQILMALLNLWGGDTVFVNGRPCHSLSQDLIESGNQAIEMMIAARKQVEKIDVDSNQYPWVSWLPRIQFSMNCAKQEKINDVPYHVVFGRSIPSSIFPGAKGCFYEEHFGDAEDKTETQTLAPSNSSPEELNNSQCEIFFK